MSSKKVVVGHGWIHFLFYLTYSKSPLLLILTTTTTNYIESEHTAVPRSSSNLEPTQNFNSALQTMEYQDEPGAWESVLDVLKEDAYKLGGQQLLDALDLKHTTILSDPKFNPKHETLKKYMGTELDHYTAVVEFALWDNICMYHIRWLYQGCTGSRFY